VKPLLSFVTVAVAIFFFVPDAVADRPLVVTRQSVLSLAPARVFEMYVDCLIKDPERKVRALQFLKFVPEDPRLPQLSAKLSWNDCVPVDRTGSISSIKYEIPDLRGMLFIVFYRQGFPKFNPTVYENKNELNINAEFVANEVPLADSDLKNRQFGDCVAKTAPRSVHKLLHTDVSSDAEKIAWEGVSPVLSQCLSTSDKAISGKPILRRVLAEAMFKRAAGLVHFTELSAGTKP
jgi:hypothetical protein